MSKPTAESLFDLYRKLQELYQMKESLPSRYQRGEVPKGGMEHLAGRISRSYPLTYTTDCTSGRAGSWCLVSRGASQEGFGVMSGWGWCESRRGEGPVLLLCSWRSQCLPP